MPRPGSLLLILQLREQIILNKLVVFLIVFFTERLICNRNKIIPNCHFSKIDLIVKYIPCHDVCSSRQHAVARPTCRTSFPRRSASKFQHRPATSVPPQNPHDRAGCLHVRREFPAPAPPAHRGLAPFCQSGRTVPETPDTASLLQYAKKHLFADTHVKSPRTPG